MIATVEPMAKAISTRDIVMSNIPKTGFEGKSNLIKVMRGLAE